MSEEQTPSNWQQAITGEWHGYPSVFAADGTHVGINKVTRASEFEGDRTTYWMQTNFDATGQLAHRFDMGDTQMKFGVIDSDADRIYCGPDFMGAGRPFGMLVDSNYYSPGWNTDLRTVNLVLPERRLQVYSSQLFEGPTLVAVFNGIYTVTQDHATNPETQKYVDKFLEAEKRNGRKPHVLPVKHAGQYRGTLEVYDSNQERLGTTDVSIDYTPLNLTRAACKVSMEGVIERSFSYERSRNHNTHTFEGPDVYGNGRAYGRVLWTVQHFYGEAFKLRSRETLLTDDQSLVVVWQFYKSDRELYTVFGVLDWHEGENVLGARYVG